MAPYAALAAAVTLAACGSSSPEDSSNAQPVSTTAFTTENTAEGPAFADPAAATLDAQLTAIGDPFEGYLGIAVRAADDTKIVHYNGELFFPQQSVSKLWVALAALDAQDDGELDLAEQATIRFDDLTLFHQPVRKTVLRTGSFTASYRELLERALAQSDNTANDMLLRRVGGSDAVRKVLVEKGLGGIRFGPGEKQLQSDLAGLQWRQEYAVGKRFFEAREQVPDAVRQTRFDQYVLDAPDGATPIALVNALTSLANGKLLSDASTAVFLGILAETKSGPNRLKGGLPEGWSIAHKTGTGQVWGSEQSGYNDVGILTAPDGSRYAVAVLIGRSGVPVPQRMDMMHQVVTAVARYHQDRALPSAAISD